MRTAVRRAFFCDSGFLQRVSSSFFPPQMPQRITDYQVKSHGLDLSPHYPSLHRSKDADSIVLKMITQIYQRNKRVIDRHTQSTKCKDPEAELS